MSTQLTIDGETIKISQSGLRILKDIATGRNNNYVDSKEKTIHALEDKGLVRVFDIQGVNLLGLTHKSIKVVDKLQLQKSA